MPSSQEIVAVVDDDPEIRCSLAALISAFGYDALTFDSAETFRKLFPKLARSYGLDALSSQRGEAGGAPVPSKTQVADFLKSVADAKVSTFAGVGEGEDLRLEAEGLTGAALAVDDRIVHLSAFRMPSIRG